jgi:hypothetical protein
MKMEDFFDNLSVFFGEEEVEFVDVVSNVYRDEDGKITEVRIFNRQYDEFLVIERDGTTYAISVPGEKDLVKK